MTVNGLIDPNVAAAFSSDLLVGEKALWAQSARAAPFYKTALSFFLNAIIGVGAVLFAFACFPQVWTWLNVFEWPTITVALYVLGFGFSVGVSVLMFWGAWQTLEHNQSIYMITNRRILGRQNPKREFFAVSGRPIDYVGVKAGPSECFSLLLRLGKKRDAEDEIWVELLRVDRKSVV